MNHYKLITAALLSASVLTGCTSNASSAAVSAVPEPVSDAEAIQSVSADTYVGDYGRYVSAFAFEVAEGFNTARLNADCFAFEGTSKHPSAAQPSLGAYAVAAEGTTVTVTVDPFLYNDAFTASCTLDGAEVFTFTKETITDVKTAVVDDFEALTTEQGLTYRLYKPETEEKLPIVITFHGNGEQGTDNYLQMVNNRVTTKWGEPASQAKYPCVVLGPQAHDGWSDDELDDVRAIVDGLIEEGVVDGNRVYCAGLAGFEATIRFCVKNADLVAGAIPMIYWKDFDPEDISPLKDIPLWMCIAENDFTGEAPHIIETAEYLQSLGSDQVQYTIWTDEEMYAYGLYGGLLHWGWIPAINNPEMCDWLFAQSK